MTQGLPADVFLSELDRCVGSLRNYLLSDRYVRRFKPRDIEEAVTLYVASGGKRLRPAILMWSCGALGGEPELALPAAASVEIFHTWTLVHDDIIDRDDRRRGNDTVHERFRKVAHDRYGKIRDEDALHYGTSVAILAGDVQHGWNVSMLTELTRERNVDPSVTLALIRELNDSTINLLIEGELLDLQFSRLPLSDLSIEDIEDMLWKKTGVLYRFCAWAGGMIGLGKAEPEHPHLTALAEFAGRCGVAFQLQDDVLGVVGEPKVTGKPVGNDIREGKRTTVLYYAWSQANEDEREFLEHTVGNANASEEDIQRTIDILRHYGGVEKTRERASGHIAKALPALDKLPPSRYRDLLRSWADYMIDRRF